MKLNWQDNIAKAGGVEFSAEEYGPAYRLRIKISGLVVYSNELYFKSESEARAAAEEIARAIFKGEPLLRRKIAAYGDTEFVRPIGNEDPRAWQRGLFVPLEGE